MEITFTRTGERTHSIIATRDDGVTVSIRGFDYPAGLPHDLAHFVVECELGLQQGFWGRVAAGALFSGVEIVEGRQPPHAGERSRTAMRSEPQRGTEAEVLVALIVQITQRRLEANWTEVQKLLKGAWQPTKERRQSLQPDEIRWVCLKLRDTWYDWQVLEVGQSLSVVWPYKPLTQFAKQR